MLECVRQIVPTTANKVVNDANLGNSRRKELIDDCASDEARPTCYKTALFFEAVHIVMLLSGLESYAQELRRRSRIRERRV
jgi:hypothetical protein